ncbi:hypothetical protein N7466_007511 [Penicillium verhagenii]|uniref:uncharacterized protein n=1 Tax=Penicillium verhagenii TaxID=1562060 RepID=UPI002544F4A6|nr:uncharacterized protein N7466_007511 [Penicillium verhagenii]KAJ5928555.1 hypothetical protein N7466_007511 [Penicillium verhagenii]
MSILRLGILGASENVQTIIIPILASPALKTLFNPIIIYAASEGTAKQCQAEFNISEYTTNASEVISHPEVDVVLNLLPFEYHEEYTIDALRTGKHVMVEVPLTMSIPALHRIRKAIGEGKAYRSGLANNTALGPPKIFVGCARRYAPCFVDVFKQELASLDRVYYARCRNISGPLRVPTPEHPPAARTNGNGTVSNGMTNGHTNGNGTVNGYTDCNATNCTYVADNVTPVTSDQRFNALLGGIFNDEDLTPERAAFCRFLGGMGCHDLSLMRESLGLPDAVANVSITDPFYSAIFHYEDSLGICASSGEAHPFTVLYETGVDSVPRSDAHLTVYGATKTISVEYDFPISAELAANAGAGAGQIKVVVEERELGNGKENMNGNGNGNGNGYCDGFGSHPRVKRTEFVSSIAEAYERQFRVMHNYLTDGDSAGTGFEPKTTTNDAVMDLRLLNMIFAHYDRQCGTIRTPLG